jgi:peptide/nickel transport system substrate-binding protein
MAHLRVRARYLARSLVAIMFLTACTQPAPSAPTAAHAATVAKPAATAAPAATTAPAAPAPTTAPAAAGATATDLTLVYGFTQNPVGGCDGTQITVVATTGNCPLLNQEALIRYDDATKKIVPGLAESWTYDGMSATFKLRSGVKFQDGTPFNADAVVYNYRRVWDPNFPANQGVKFPYANNVPFKSVEKVDDMTVKVDFTKVRADTLLYMTTWPAMIQSPTALQAMSPADYTFKPVGTGPYVVTAYQDNARIEMDRNDSYWGPKPAFKKVVMVIKQDSAALVNDLLSGAIDAMRDPSIEQMDQITGRGLKIDTSNSLIFYGAQINVMKPPFDDVKLRQVANYAIDKEAVANLSKGQAKAMYGAVPDHMREYNADVPDYKYDPKKAAQLLDEAGWTLPSGAKVRQKNGEPLSVSIIQRTGYSGATALLTPTILSNLQDVGFDVKTVTVEQALQYTDQGYFDTSKWNIGIGGWSSAIPDATATLSLWTSALLRPNGLNMGGYSNEEFDQKMTDAAAAIDTETHDKLLKEAQMILKNDAPWLWVYQQQNVIAFNPAKVSAAPFRDLGVLDILRVQPK